MEIGFAPKALGNTFSVGFSNIIAFILNYSYTTGLLFTLINRSKDPIKASNNTHTSLALQPETRSEKHSL